MYVDEATHFKKLDRIITLLEGIKYRLDEPILRAARRREKRRWWQIWKQKD